MQHHDWALILAGGDGTRLQELTRRLTGAPIPKQYCRIAGPRSLLEDTLERIRPLVAPERTAAIVNRNHLALACPQLASLPRANLIVQPCNRDTGPGLLFALQTIDERDPDACITVFPSDHFVANASRFRTAVRRARQAVAEHGGVLALVGIRPEWADTGMGYIEAGVPVGTGVQRVVRFHEKPAHHTARALVDAGALWNAFVMVFRAREVLDLIAAHRPDDVVAMQRLRAQDLTATGYGALAPWNFSGDFLHRVAERLLVIEAQGTGWSDWGTPQAIERSLTRLGRPLPWGGQAVAA